MESRLARVRQLMKSSGYDALIVPRADEYLGEYIPAHNERLQWISGFNGSAGVVVILQDTAAIFTDGRYTVQVRQEVSADYFQFHHLIEEPHLQWLKDQLPSGSRVSYDPRLHPLVWQRAASNVLGGGGLELVADTDNLIDRSWDDRPEPNIGKALLLAEQYTGESSVAKRHRIGEAVSQQGANAALIFAPDSVSWLLNIRGTDIPCLPIVQSFAMLGVDGSMVLFVDPGRVPEGFADHVGEGVEVMSESAAQDIFKQYEGQTVLADPSACNAWTQLLLSECGATLLSREDPVLLPKACKNTVEIQGTRSAHIRDAIAEVKFLTWLDAEVAKGNLYDEAVLADKLLSFRQLAPEFRDSSFDTISATGANAAMCHYNFRNGVPGQMEMGSVYLVDSGAQYPDGTTDITRTVAIGDPGDEVRRMYTLVLKGHIALAQARFPRGTTGTQLDVLARQFLWREGFDYDHGTGHGVGSFLSVHEAPQRISKASSTVALLPGMIISNEPGYYRESGFGIRCENLVVVREVDTEQTETPLLEFETITLVPFDNRLLSPDLLSESDIDWLNAYHARVRETLEPLLDGDDSRWLLEVTQPV